MSHERHARRLKSYQVDFLFNSQLVQTKQTNKTSKLRGTGPFWGGGGGGGPLVTDDITKGL